MSLPLEKSSPYGQGNKPPSMTKVEKQNKTKQKMDVEINKFQTQEFSNK